MHVDAQYSLSKPRGLALRISDALMPGVQKDVFWPLEGKGDDYFVCADLLLVLSVCPPLCLPRSAPAMTTAHALPAIQLAALGGMSAGSLQLIYRHYCRQLLYPKLHKTPKGKTLSEYQRRLAQDREDSVTAFAVGAALATGGAVPLLVNKGASLVQALQAAAVAGGVFSPLYGIVASGKGRIVAQNPLLTALAASMIGGGVGGAALAGSALAGAKAATLHKVGVTALTSAMAPPHPYCLRAAW